MPTELEEVRVVKRPIQLLSLTMSAARRIPPPWKHSDPPDWYATQS